MIMGHQKQWGLLKKLIDAGNIPQALIFSGENGLGKKKIAFQFIKLLNCQEPDLIFISPQKKQIQIEQVRDLKKILAKKPSLSSMQTVLIDDAHSLNIDSQNCFLKTLEEPTGRILFIFITAYPDILLKTIRSRCQILKFYPLSKKEMFDRFKAHSSLPQFEKIINLAQGRPGLANNFFIEPKMAQEHFQMLENIAGLLESSLWQRLIFIKKLLGKEEGSEKANLFLENLVVFLRVLLLQKIGIENRLLALPALKGFKDYSVLRLKEMIESAQYFKFIISSTNVNIKLAMENLLLRL